MAASDFVLLKGGYCVPLAPLLLVLRLEERGVHLHRDGADLRVRPWSQVSTDERAELKRWKAHVLALVDYVPTEAQ